MLNLSKPFPPSPAPQKLPLPFEIDEMAFSLWFNALTTLDDMTKCTQIFHVLQTLNNTYPPESKLIPGRTRLFFLEKMGTALTISTTRLTYFPSIPESSSDGVETNDDMPKSEISVWSSLELAKAFSFLSQEDWFKDYRYYSVQEKSLILSSGINAMGRGLLYTYQVYAKPYLYFWHNCFEFYRLAELSRLTQSEINPHSKHIEDAFKRVLVFALSNTNQFTPSEMRSIFELLGHYAKHTGLLRSIPKKKFNGIPSIRLNANEAPAISESDPEEHDPNRLFIATVTVASKILEATYENRDHHLPTDRLMLLRLARTLTLNDQRKNPRETVDGNHFGIMGFDNIVTFLRGKEIQQQNILAKTGQFDPSRPGELIDLDYTISPQSNESLPPSAFHVIEFTDTSEIWKDNQQASYEANVYLIDKSKKGFGLLWTDNLIKPKVGRMIGVMHKNLTIGLIRWLAQSKETGMFMGVEIMGSNAMTVKVHNPGYPNDTVQAIFLIANEASTQGSSLIIMNKEFQPGEFIFIQKNLRNIRYRITRQLHLTSFINHVEVVRSH